MKKNNKWKITKRDERYMTNFSQLVEEGYGSDEIVDYLDEDGNIIPR